MNVTFSQYPWNRVGNFENLLNEKTNVLNSRVGNTLVLMLYHDAKKINELDENAHIFTFF